MTMIRKIIQQQKIKSRPKKDLSEIYPLDKTIMEFIEEQAMCIPEKPAVDFEGRGFSYAELNGRANQLARLLLKKGIKPGDPIAVMLDRSAVLVVCMLAIWKIGGIYIPLEPRAPEEYNFAILNGISSGMLLSYSEGVNQQLARDFPGNILEIDKAFGQVNTQDPSNLEKHVPLSEPAFVTYVSIPDGYYEEVILSHGDVIERILWKNADLYLRDEPLIIAQTASHTLTSSLWQFFGSMLTGGKTVIYPGYVIKSADFISQVMENEVEVLEASPVLVDYLLTYLEGGKGDLSGLKYFILSGDLITPEQVERWSGLYPQMILVQEYEPYRNLCYTRKNFTEQRVFFPIPKKLVKELQQIGHQLGTDLNIVILAIFSILIAKYSGKKEITLELGVDWRHVLGEEIELDYHPDQVEPFITRVQMGLSFREYLLGIKKGASSVGDGQKTMLVNGIFSWSQTPHKVSIDQLMSVALEKLQNQNDDCHNISLGQSDIEQPNKVFDQSGGELKSEQAYWSLTDDFPTFFARIGSSYGDPMEMSNYLFVHGFELGKGEISIAIEYSQELFSRQSIWRFAHHFMTLLRQVVKYPDRLLEEMPLLSEDEKEVLFFEWEEAQGPNGTVKRFVLDDHGNLQPIGVEGDLWLGGEGVHEEFLMKLGIDFPSCAKKGRLHFSGEEILMTGERAYWTETGELVLVRK